MPVYRLLLKLAELGPAWFFWNLPEGVRHDVIRNMAGRL